MPPASETHQAITTLTSLSFLLCSLELTDHGKPLFHSVVTGYHRGTSINLPFSVSAHSPYLLPRTPRLQRARSPPGPPVTFTFTLALDQVLFFLLRSPHICLSCLSLYFSMDGGFRKERLEKSSHMLRRKPTQQHHVFKFSLLNLQVTMYRF